MARHNDLTLILVVAVVLAACSGGVLPADSRPPGGTTAAAAPSATVSGCAVGVSWDDRGAGRWAMWDEPAIKAALETAGATFVAEDAMGSAERQAANIETLISAGAKVLIIVARDGVAIQPTVASAISRGIQVIAYDRLIENPATLYLSFDNVEVGRMQARAVLAAAPSGNYVFIKGDKGDANADFLRAGQEEIVRAAVNAGVISNVGETYTDSWDYVLARSEMKAFLKATDGDISAALAQNDSMASGVIDALTEQHLAGRVAVSGQDGDAASLNQVALGLQTVDVWKDARMLGKMAGEAATQLCGGTEVNEVSAATAFTSPGGNTISSILLKPTPVTRDNLAVVVDAGWITRDALCKGVQAASVAACP